MTRSLVRSLTFALASGALGACSALGGAPNAPVTTGMNPATRTRHAHWTQTSIGTFADPYGVAVNPFCHTSCDVFVADPGAKRVWKIAPDGNRTAIGDWVGAAAFDPQGVAVDRSDNVYVADKEPGGTTQIWRVAPNGTTVPVAIRSVGGPRYFRGVGVTYPPTYPNPYMHTWIVAVQASYTPATVKGFFMCSCSQELPYFDDPFGVAGDARGDAFVADARSKTVYKTDAFGRNAVALRVFADPYGVAASLDGAAVYVADAGSKRVWKSDSDGGWSVVGSFADPYGVAVDASSTLYVADPGSKHVWKLRP